MSKRASRGKTPCEDAGLLSKRLTSIHITFTSPRYTPPQNAQNPTLPPFEKRLFYLFKSSGIALSKAVLLTINCSAFDEQKHCFSTPNSTAFETTYDTSSHYINPPFRIADYAEKSKLRNRFASFKNRPRTPFFEKRALLMAST